MLDCLIEEMDKETKRKMAGPMAWSNWTKEEDDQLKEQAKSGLDVKAMSEIHGRTMGAIQSRLNVIADRLLRTGTPIVRVCSMLNIERTPLENWLKKKARVRLLKKNE